MKTLKQLGRLWLSNRLNDSIETYYVILCSFLVSQSPMVSRRLQFLLGNLATSREKDLNRFAETVQYGYSEILESCSLPILSVKLLKFGLFLKSSGYDKTKAMFSIT